MSVKRFLLEHGLTKFNFSFIFLEKKKSKKILVEKFDYNNVVKKKNLFILYLYFLWKIFIKIE